MSRESRYSRELAEQICERIAEGESLRQICETAGMPNRSTVFRWLERNKSFATKYARAREHQADYMDDLVLDEAKGCTAENFQAAKVKIGAYQWRASKLQPKKYGDKIETTLRGDPAAPLASVNIATTDPAEAMRAYQAMIEASNEAPDHGSAG